MKGSIDMLLAELLARELEDWPKGAKIAVQDCDLEVKFAEVYEADCSISGIWLRGGSQNFEKLQAEHLATDHATAIVTREMWEAERARQAPQPDWSKAPEGATHWYSAKDCPEGKAWRKKAGEANWQAWIDGEWLPIILPIPREYIPRPTTPQWTGDGLPPVGVTVEIGATTGIVVAHDAGRAVVRVFPGFDDYVAVTADKLRPLRTPRDKWIEAAERTLEENTSLIASSFQLGILFDAGLAKLPEDGE